MRPMTRRSLRLAPSGGPQKREKWGKLKESFPRDHMSSIVLRLEPMESTSPASLALQCCTIVFCGKILTSGTRLESRHQRLAQLFCFICICCALRVLFCTIQHRFCLDARWIPLRNLRYRVIALQVSKPIRARRSGLENQEAKA